MDKTEFFSLLDKYLNGEASAQEEEQLLNFYYSFQNTSDDASPRLSKELEDKMMARISAGIEAEEGEVRVVPIWRKITLAAVILISVSFSLFMYLHKNHQPMAEALLPVKKDLEPGKDKATLTLANGTTISLDDAAFGEVAYEGSTTITKTADGQIKYVARKDAKVAPQTHSAMNTIYTPRGGKYRVVLPDGSRVWLNSESSLRYPTSFTQAERKVTLTGEAYFEIAPDKKVPFRVETNGQVVEVLGTHFNISSYANEAVKTTLLEGSVRVIQKAADGKKTVKLLKPGQQSLVDPSHEGITVENANTEKAMAWKNGYFQFQNTDIEEVMREVSRWYDVEVVFAEKVPQEEFTGFISRKVKLSVVLKILEQGGGVSFSVNGRKVKVKSSQHNTP